MHQRYQLVGVSIGVTGDALKFCGQTQQWVGGTGDAHGGTEVVGHPGHSQSFGDGGPHAGRRCRHHGHVNVGRSDPGIGQGGGEGLGHQRAVGHFGKFLVPGAAHGLTWDAPAVHELAGGTGSGHHLGQHRGVGVIVGHHHGGSSVATSGFLG